MALCKLRVGFMCPAPFCKPACRRHIRENITINFCYVWRGVNIVSWGQLIVAEVCDIGATAKTSEQTSKAAVEAPTIRAGSLARLSMPRQCLDGAEFCIAANCADASIAL